MVVNGSSCAAVGEFSSEIETIVHVSFLQLTLLAELHFKLTRDQPGVKLEKM